MVVKRRREKKKKEKKRRANESSPMCWTHVCPFHAGGTTRDNVPAVHIESVDNSRVQTVIFVMCVSLLYSVVFDQKNK